MEIKSLLITVPDVEAAIAFYVNKMGFRLAFRDGGRWASVESGQIRLALASAEEVPGVTGPALMVRVEDLDRTIDILTAAGAELRHGPVLGTHEYSAVMESPEKAPLVLYGKVPSLSPSENDHVEGLAVPSAGHSVNSGGTLEPEVSVGRVAVGDDVARERAAVFRDVMGHFASGVAVITTRQDERDYGMTANAVSSLSLDPPMLLICLNLASATQRAVASSGSFAVNILDEAQTALAHKFATHGPDKFEGASLEYGELGVPLLTDSLANVECRVVSDIVGGTHRVFLAEVTTATASPGSPLAYFRGKFGRLDVAQDMSGYDQLREMVLRREWPLEDPLDVPALSERLALPSSSIGYALVRLSGEGLVYREVERGYLQSPVDREVSDSALQAKLVIDLGVADLICGQVSEAQATELHDLAASLLPLIVDGTVTDVNRYLEGSVAFHEYLIGLSGNTQLVEAYRRLSIPEVVHPALSHSSMARQRLAQGRLDLARSLHDGSRETVRQIMVSQHRLARDAQVAAIEEAGGRL